MPDLVIVGAIVFLAFAVQTVSGFGSMLVALAAGAHFVDIELLIAWVVPLSIVSCGYVAVRYRGDIDWRLLGWWIGPWMGVGVVAGIVARTTLASDALQLGFAGFVVVLAARELYMRLGTAQSEQKPMPAVARGAALVGAGIMHGIYATGGPMLVYVLGRTNLSKSAFRTTLMVVWIGFALVLVGDFARTGALAVESVYLLPAAMVGVAVGELLHHRIDHRRFELLVFALLAASGVLMIATGL